MLKNFPQILSLTVNSSLYIIPIITLLLTYNKQKHHQEEVSFLWFSFLIFVYVLSSVPVSREYVSSKISIGMSVCLQNMEYIYIPWRFSFVLLTMMNTSYHGTWDGTVSMETGVFTICSAGNLVFCQNFFGICCLLLTVSFVNSSFGRGILIFEFSESHIQFCICFICEGSRVDSLGSKLLILNFTY